MPKPGWRKQPGDSRLTDHISIGFLTKTLTKDLIDEILFSTNKVEKRTRLLPARVVMYYTIAMPMFPQGSYEEVMRHLTQGLFWAKEFEGSWHIPSKAGIYKARVRLGAGPLKELFSRVAKLLAQPGMPGAFYRNLRLVVIDRTSLDVCDSQQNLEHFTKPETPIGETAFAKVRIVALSECGTHAIIADAPGPYSVSEQLLVREIVPSPIQGMLCLGDRGIFSYDLWNKARETGCELLWRAESDYVIETVAELNDGSYLGNVYHHQDRTRRNPIQLRVIEYSLDDRADPDNIYRLFSIITDPELARVSELAALYSQRWEIESVFDELKTHLNESRQVLRSQSPELVYIKSSGGCWRCTTRFGPSCATLHKLLVGTQIDYYFWDHSGLFVELRRQARVFPLLTIAKSLKREQSQRS